MWLRRNSLHITIRGFYPNVWSALDLEKDSGPHPHPMLWTAGRVWGAPPRDGTFLWDCSPEDRHWLVTAPEHQRPLASPHQDNPCWFAGESGAFYLISSAKALSCSSQKGPISLPQPPHPTKKNPPFFSMRCFCFISLVY